MLSSGSRLAARALRTSSVSSVAATTLKSRPVVSRRYASGAPGAAGHPKPSSDVPWALIATLITVAGGGYLYTTGRTNLAALRGHGHGHDPHGAAEKADNVVQSIDDTVRASVADAKDAATDAASKVSSSLESAKDSASKSVSSGVDKVNDLAQDAQDAISQKAAELSKRAAELDSRLKELESEAAKTFNATKGSVSEAATRLKDGTWEVIDKAEAQGVAAKDAVVKKAVEVADKLRGE